MGADVDADLDRHLQGTLDLELEVDVGCHGGLAARLLAVTPCAVPEKGGGVVEDDQIDRPANPIEPCSRMARPPVARSESYGKTPDFTVGSKLP